MRIIGLDIHRAFAEAVAWQDGKLKRLTCAALKDEPGYPNRSCRTMSAMPLSGTCESSIGRGKISG